MPVQLTAGKPAEENTLAIMKARLAAMAPTDRWYPVLLRYIGLIAGRVQGLGGDPGKIPPSFGGAPIAILTGGTHGHRDHGEHHDEHRYTGMIAGLLFDHFGDFVGFEPDTCEREHRCDSPRARYADARRTRLARAAAGDGRHRAA
jgi:hypothetical protein